MADYDISEAFQKIEEEMIASMSRNLKRHLKKELDEGINYSMWQAEQLAALNNFRKNNEKTFKSYFSTVNKQIETILKMAYQSGAMDQEAQILEAIKKGWKVRDLPTTDILQGSFFKINERKLTALIEATQKDMAKAETAMLRMANDEYRKVIYNSEVYYNTGAGTLSQCVDMATKDFLSRGITCIEYANGARVAIDSYAQMALRTAQTRAYLTGEASKRDEWGVSTVRVNRNGVACPRCLRYIGQIFYDDVWGSAPIPSPPKYPRLSEAIAGGLYHPNCRDIHSTYFEDFSSPSKPLTEEEKKEAARVYDLEQKQRYNERMIRKYKRLSAGSTDPENVKKYEAKLSEWQAHQREFVKANGDVLKRRYENEKLRLPSVPEPKEISEIPKTKGLTNVGEDGIIKPLKMTTDEKSALTRYISSESYGLNRALRTGATLTAEQEMLRDGLISALDKLPSYEGTVYRSLSSEMMENLEAFNRLHTPGNIVSYSAFTSTGTEVYDASMDIQLIIQSKSGKDIRVFNPNEHEILFPQNARFQVVDRQGNAIWMEEV